MTVTAVAILFLATAFVSLYVGFLIGAAFAETWIREAHWWRMRAEDAEDRLAARSVGGRFGETANRG